MRDESLMLDNENANTRDFDRFLLSGLKNRDVAAFDYIYRRWETPLVKFIASIVGSKAVAEDICQETFIRLWLTCDSIDPGKNIKTYLFLISKRLTLNYIRSLKRENAFFSNRNVDESHHSSPDKMLEDTELESTIQYTIGTLSPQTRKVFDLFYFENLSYKQIADRLNMSPNHVAVQVHKARAKLEKAIFHAFF